jgi:hypothetical protein
MAEEIMWDSVSLLGMYLVLYQSDASSFAQAGL